jgi:hypothetical protein
MQDDINVIYWGGSGGFYLLFQLLLTKQFVCQFDNGQTSDDVDLNQLIKDQFTFSSYENWKKNEKLPFNELTKKILTSKRKVYFHCNEYKDFDKSNKNIFLYTDSRSQIRLASLKNAYYWYNMKVDSSFIKYLIRNSKNNMFKEVFILKYGVEKFGGTSVKLQNIVNPIGLTEFFTKINVTVTKENLEFIDFWKNLHPPKLLQKIQIE